MGFTTQGPQARGKLIRLAHTLQEPQLAPLTWWVQFIVSLIILAIVISLRLPSIYLFVCLSGPLVNLWPFDFNPDWRYKHSVESYEIR